MSAPTPQDQLFWHLDRACHGTGSYHGFGAASSPSLCADQVSTGPFGVGQADVKAMAQTMDFITFIINNKTDPLTLAFRDLWKDTSRPQVTFVNHFFAHHQTYASCTFATYMMAIAYTAQQPKTRGKPLGRALFSLSALVTLLGGTWPSFLPDIVVAKFTCNTHSHVLAIQVEIDLEKLPAQSDAALRFFGSLFDVPQLHVAVSFHAFVDARLSVSLDTLHVPFGDSATLAIKKPTVTLDINPLFKFVVFTVTGDIPLHIFGKQLEADVSMVIDNIEANFGVVIKGDKTSLPAPPLMKGVHFDTFGAGIGIIFEPPSAAIGLSGQWHIGDPGSRTLVALDDDTFVLVCQVIEGVPNPRYISFYVPRMHLTDIYTVFTNVQCPVDVPVLFTNLSFLWSANPMEPLALPDGSLSNMGYGFSAAAKMSDFSFYGDVEIDLTNGLAGDVEMAPLALGSIFSIRGDGAGVSVKVDANGNPIKNNQLVTKAAQKQALKNATTKQLVPPGGPVLKLQTLAPPFLHLNGVVNLFEADNVRLDANITSSGITFDVGFGGLLISKMSCTLSNPLNLSAAFRYGINDTISLPSHGGSCESEAASNSKANLAIWAISRLMAWQLFDDLLGTGAAWAGKVKQNVIRGFDSVASVLQNAFKQDAGQVAFTMKDAGFEADEIVEGLASAFGMTPLGVAQVMQQVGYAGEQVASALQHVFGNDAAQIASALSGAYGWSANQINGVLGQIGFSANEISQAFQSLGGQFDDFGKSILRDLDPSGWALP
ncbi:hypothetical protein Cob_v002232 [Colletotrichum orbiculare MAFF 240422]|uniref:Uncharacterized protein n=1 Tax=Colletotrichum orbiculare (strain 104-T / ATCC 96160 / CBS 514.97 / LARS 414 / MAFF 240422) TaxID=1213857 RepID=A0A484G3Q5_COLOR|nr:hypothetical protein Cob_v002232 [Colletotrichum orbiculare MAFF 240422]